jgi:hypothetical protein
MCRGTKFTEVINMGEQPLVNSLVSLGDMGEERGEESWPLVVERCSSCGLVQIVNPVDANKIYRDEDYLYFSGDMPTLEDYFENYARFLDNHFIDEGDLVIEIGSNDGIMLNSLMHMGKAVGLGVDPASNVVSRALRKGIPTISDFFTHRLAKSIKRDWGVAKVIYGNNCIAHLSDLYDLMDGVYELLALNGTFVVECNYWGGMVENVNYSLIYHDHFSYFSLKNWVDFLNLNKERWDMEVFDATVTPAQGGSLRLFVGRRNQHEKQQQFKELLAKEEETKLNSKETCEKYREDVEKKAKQIGERVKTAVASGKKVAGYGAAAKGFSILSLAGIYDEKYIKYFVDDSPAKQEKYTPLSHIPIMSRDMAERTLPDVFIITAPNYADVIKEKERQKGYKGDFIIP